VLVVLQDQGRSAFAIADIMLINHKSVRLTYLNSSCTTNHMPLNNSSPIPGHCVLRLRTRQQLDHFEVKSSITSTTWLIITSLARTAEVNIVCAWGENGACSSACGQNNECDCGEDMRSVHDAAGAAGVQMCEMKGSLH
jgi:hypothetical protein